MNGKNVLLCEIEKTPLTLSQHHKHSMEGEKLSEMISNDYILSHAKLFILLYNM